MGLCMSEDLQICRIFLLKTLHGVGDSHDKLRPFLRDQGHTPVRPQLAKSDLETLPLNNAG